MKPFLKLNSKTKSVLMRVLGVGAVGLIIGCSTLMSRTQSAASQDAKLVDARQFGDEAGALANEIVNMIDAEQYTESLAKISEALALTELTPYERSTLYQMQGQAHYELDDYKAAVLSFENAIYSGGLLPSENASLRLNIAQLLIANGQPARGAQMLENWVQSGGQLKPHQIEILWQAWVQAERYDRALPWAQKWFDMADPREPKHYDVMSFLYSELYMPIERAEITKQMKELGYLD